jgi:hypothetical protein
METPEVVVEPSSKEAIESRDMVEQPVDKTESQSEVAAAEPVEGEQAQTEEKQEDQKPEEENSVIRQMRKQLRAQQKMISELRTQQMQRNPEPIPQRENFESDADYIKAEVAYQFNQAQKAVPKTPDVFESKFEEAKKTHADFEEALQDIEHVLFTPEAQMSIKQAVETLPYGSDVLYHIAKNPELAEELAILPPAAFAARLGDIHGDIRQSKTVKKITKAPAPITPVSAVSKAEKSYDDMDQAEFVAMRRKQKLAYQKARFGL